MRVLLKIILALASVVVSWLPFVILAVMGGAYLWEVVNYVLAPGESVVFQYQSQAGPSKVTIGSYAIDLDAKRISLNNVMVADARGRKALDVNRAQAWLEGPAIQVQVDEGSAVLDRLEGGQLDLEGLIPPAPKEQGEFGLKVDVRRINLVYRDKKIQRVVKAQIDGLRVEQGDTETVVKAVVQPVGAPSMSLQVHAGKDGRVEIWSEAKNFEASSWLGLIQSWLPKEAVQGWKGMTAKKLLVSGPIHLITATDKAPIIASNKFSMEAENLTIPGAITNWTGSGKGSIEDGLLLADAVLNRPGARLQAEGGAILYPFKAAARFRLAADSPRSVWKEAAGLLPKEASFRSAVVTGLLRYGKDLEVQGDVRAQSLAYGRDAVANPVGRLAYNGNRLAVDLDNGSSYQRPVRGWIDWLTKSDVMTGSVESPKGPLGPALARAGQRGFSGEGSVVAVLRGKASDPIVNAQASVNGRYQWDPKDRGIRISQADLRAQIGKSGLKLDRGTLVTPTGIATALGTLDWKGAMDIQVEGTGLRLASFVPDAQGTGFVQGHLRGTAKQLLFAGQVEGYGLEYQGRKAAWLKGDVNYNSQGIAVTRLRGQAGSGYLLGEALWNPKTDKVSGRLYAENLFYSDWIPADLVGTFDIENGELSGTAKAPVFQADIKGSRAIAFGVRSDKVDGKLQATSKALTVSNLRATFGQGAATGSLEYLLGTGVLAGKVDYDSIPLSRAPVPAEFVLVDGLASGTVNLSGNQKDGFKADTQASITNLEVNATPIGSGQASISYAGDSLSGSAEIGSLERFVALRSFSANLKDKTIQADGDVLNFEVSTLAKALKDSWDEQPVNVQEAIRSAEGLLSGALKVTGSTDAPDFSIERGTLAEIQFLGRSAGALDFSGTKKGQEFELSGLHWLIERKQVVRDGATVDQDTILDASKATYSEEKGVDLFLSLTNFDLTWLSRFSPDFPGLGGIADATMVATGKPDSLVLQGTVLAKEGSLQSPDGKAAPLFETLNIDTMNLENGVLEASGWVKVRGIDGVLSANVPLKAFDEDATDVLNASIAIREVDGKGVSLDRFKEYLADSKDDIFEGDIKGGASFSGRVGAWKAEANLHAQGTKIRRKGFGTGIDDFSMDLLFKDRAVTANGSMRGSRGGEVTLDQVQALLPTLFDEGQTIDDILQSSRLSGRVGITALDLAQPLASGTADTTTRLDGEVLLGGSLASARVGGGIKASGSNVVIPSAFPESAPGSAAPYEPTFENFRLEASQGTNIRFGLGRLQVAGQGVVNGPVSALNLRMPLTVQDGQLRLPNARIKLQEGGRVDVAYSADSGLPLRVLVDMEGQTNVTARRGADAFESYEVFLQFRGDLLDPNGLNITAQSDPGDLTSSEILAILGQRELLEALAATALQGRGPAALRDPLYQIGIPSLTDPLTSKIAAALNLDYLGLEYNPFDGAIYRISKTLAPGLVAQGWRQLTEPQFGPFKYDLRLSYRLPIARKYLDRVRVGIGTTHDRPWRITIDWGRRF